MKAPVTEGDRFAALGDFEARVLTQWRAPFTGGHKAVVPQGTVVVAIDDQRPPASGFACRPEASHELESLLVPVKERAGEKYAGHYLVLKARRHRE